MKLANTIVTNISIFIQISTITFPSLVPKINAITIISLIIYILLEFIHLLSFMKLLLCSYDYYRENISTLLSSKFSNV